MSNPISVPSSILPTDRLHAVARFLSSHWRFALVLGVAVVTLAGLCSRTVMPVDETRYLAVAWEMWWRGEFVLPHLNGLPYDHKPPLLFWLIHLGWAVFGVNEWWPRLIGPLSSLVSAGLLAALAQRLAPRMPQIGPVAASMFVGSTYIAVYQTGVMFDLLLLATLMLGWLGLHRAVISGCAADWALFAAGGALGLLCKGPVALLYLLPPLLAVPWWRPVHAVRLDWRKASLAVLLMLLPVLAWVFAAGVRGGEQFLQDILINQTADRVQGAMGHPRPFHWYVKFLLLLPMPWLLWPTLWRRKSTDGLLPALSGQRFLWAVIGPTLLVLTVVSGKQVHYLIPLLALFMIWLADRACRSTETRKLDAWPWVALPILYALAVLILPLRWTPSASPASGAWLAALALWAISGLAYRLRHLAHRNAVALWSVLHSVALSALLVGVFDTIGPDYQLTDMAQQAAGWQSEGRELAYVGVYQGELQFLGRLRDRITPLAVRDVGAWASAHPNGRLMMRDKRVRLASNAVVVARQRYKRGEWLVIDAEEFLAQRAIAVNPR
jgi:4-amino-4-deoxy-L-arabinose transferase-like glycosyltransferase